MEQLPLELTQYPMPLAWAIEEINAAHGYRERRERLLSAYEKVIGYLLLIESARYVEFRESGCVDAAVEASLTKLRRPALGHRLQALRELDRFLSERGDRYGCALLARRSAPMMCKLYGQTDRPRKRFYSVSLFQVFARVSKLRGEGSPEPSSQVEGEPAVALLQRAFAELLDALPLLLAQPLVQVERIESAEGAPWVVTLLELMGARRPQRVLRRVASVGGLRKGLLYMWDGEAPPLRLSPLFHLAKLGSGEGVFVLSDVQGNPVYHLRGKVDRPREPGRGSSAALPPVHPSREEGAGSGFTAAGQGDGGGGGRETWGEGAYQGGWAGPSATLEVEATPNAVPGPRVPALSSPTEKLAGPVDLDRARVYRNSVELALAGGAINGAVVEHLDGMRSTLGLTRAQASAIHGELGWLQPPGVPLPTDGERPGSADRTQDLRSFLKSVQERTTGHLPRTEPLTMSLDASIGIGSGQLSVSLGAAKDVSVRFAGRRADRVRLVVGFYSRNEKRDPRYRTARRALLVSGLSLPRGWSELSPRNHVKAGLGLESSRTIPFSRLLKDPVIDEVVTVLTNLTMRARQELLEPPLTPERVLAEPAAVPEVAAIPDRFSLPALSGAARLRGSVWLARILWALEVARQNGAEPLAAAEIARTLCDHGVPVLGTNTARAFRTPKDDPRRSGLCQELHGQRYAITAKGRRVLYEWIASESGQPADVPSTDQAQL